MGLFDTELPIDEALPRLTAALGRVRTAVLVAPPGAGKTTACRCGLLDSCWAADKKILVLEPRRLAARAAAERMAATLSENVGETVGLRCASARRCRARRGRGDHRRRLHADSFSTIRRSTALPPCCSTNSMSARSTPTYGLALAREVQLGLRDDLRLVVMSATLDGARVAKLLGGAPVIESEGRAFPVETRYRGRSPNVLIERQMADTVALALRADSGSILAFLPGQAEIRRTETFLRELPLDPRWTS